MEEEQLSQNGNGESLTTAEENSVIDMLRFDPFAEKGGAAAPADSKGAGAAASPGQASPRSEEAAPQPTPDGAPGTSTPAPGQPAAEAPAAQPAPQPAAQPSSLDVAAQRLVEAADRLQAPQQAQPQNQPKDDIPAYLYDIPPQLLEKLDSENPADRATALQALVQGTARSVHIEVMKQINEVKAALPQIFQQMTQAAEYRAQVRKDFYGAYPVLDNPNLAPVVGQVTAQVFAEMVASGQRPSWSPQVAKTIAERVFTAIPGLRQVPAPAAQPQAQQTPPHVFTPGSRPAGGQSAADQIVDMLGL